MSVTSTVWGPGNGEHDLLTNISVSSSVCTCALSKLSSAQNSCHMCCITSSVSKVTRRLWFPRSANSIQHATRSSVNWCSTSSHMKVGLHKQQRFLIIVWAHSLDRWNWKEGTIGGVEDIMQEGGGGGGQLRRCVRGIGGRLSLSGGGGGGVGRGGGVVQLGDYHEWTLGGRE